MHSASQSPRPADFQLAADSSDVEGLWAGSSHDDPELTDPVHGAPEQTDPERGDFLAAMRASWDDWVPVATTGWGAVVLIAPLLAVHALVWAFGGRRPREVFRF
jgi:hypothetical protein